MCYKLMHLNLIYVKIEALKILAVVYNSLGLIFIGINNKIFVTLKYKKNLLQYIIKDKLYSILQHSWDILEIRLNR